MNLLIRNKKMNWLTKKKITSDSLVCKRWWINHPCLKNMSQERKSLYLYHFTVVSTKSFVAIMYVFYNKNNNFFQWTQLVIITSILEKYYGVSTLAVYWTSMIYMVITTGCPKKVPNRILRDVLGNHIFW